MIRKWRILFAIFILKFDFNILFHQMEDGTVVHAYCCDKHLKESALKVVSSPNPIQLTLNEDGRNSEMGMFGKVKSN